jgi:hypothetical protein
MWTSLRGDFETCIKAINKAAKEVDRIAQIEHMVQTREEAKGRSQVGSVHEVTITDTKSDFKSCVSSSLNYAIVPVQQINNCLWSLLTIRLKSFCQEISPADRRS